MELFEIYRLQFVKKHPPDFSLADAAKLFFGVEVAAAHKMVKEGRWPTPLRLSPSGYLRVFTVDLAEYFFPAPGEKKNDPKPVAKRCGRPTKAEQLARSSSSAESCTSLK